MSSTSKRNRLSSLMRSTSGRPVYQSCAATNGARMPIAMSARKSPSRNRAVPIAISGAMLPTYMVMLLPRATTRPAQHRHGAGGQEQVVQCVARLPAQPGHQAPGQAGGALDHDETMEPGFGLALGLGIALIGRCHQGAGADRHGNRQRHKEGARPGDMTEGAGGTQHRHGDCPDRRGKPAGIGRLGGERQLRAQHARIAFFHRLLRMPEKHWVILNSPGAQYRPPRLSYLLSLPRPGLAFWLAFQG